MDIIHNKVSSDALFLQKRGFEVDFSNTYLSVILFKRVRREPGDPGEFIRCRIANNGDISWDIVVDYSVPGIYKYFDAWTRDMNFLQRYMNEDTFEKKFCCC